MLAVISVMLSAIAVNPVIPMDFSDPDACVGPDGRVYDGFKFRWFAGTADCRER